MDILSKTQTLKVFNQISIYFLLKVYDINHVDSNGRTIMSVIVEKNIDDIIFISNLFYLGYNIKEFNIFENNHLIAFTDQNALIKDFLTSEYLPYSKPTPSLLFAKTNNSKVYFARKTGDLNCYVLKQSDENMILKEVFFLNRITSVYDDVVPKNYGFYHNIGVVRIILEYIPFTLYDLIPYLGNNKNNILKKIFKDIILKVRKINSLGICHFDLKPSNIMICPDLTVRIIDFGLSIYAGSSPINYYLTTTDIKAPDDLFDDNSTIPNHVSEINYATDLYSIACTFIICIFGFNLQCLFIDEKFYFCKRENITERITRIEYLLEFSKSKLKSIEDFEEFFKVACIPNSLLRASCFSAFPSFDIDEHIFSFYEQNKKINVDMGKNSVNFRNNDFNTLCNIKILLSKIPEENRTFDESQFMAYISFGNFSFDIFNGDFCDEVQHIFYPCKIKYDFIFFDDLIFCYLQKHKNINSIALENFKSGIERHLISTINSCQSFNVYSLFDDFLEKCFTE